MQDQFYASWLEATLELFLNQVTKCKLARSEMHFRTVPYRSKSGLCPIRQFVRIQEVKQQLDMKPPFPSATPTWHNDTYPSFSPSRPELSVAGKAVVIAGAVGLFFAARSANMTRTRPLTQPKRQWHRPRNRIRLLRRGRKQDRPPRPQRSQSLKNKKRPSAKLHELLHPCR